jgi:hypothetical protein
MLNAVKLRKNLFILSSGDYVSGLIDFHSKPRMSYQNARLQSTRKESTRKEIEKFTHKE